MVYGLYTYYMGGYPRITLLKYGTRPAAGVYLRLNVTLLRERVRDRWLPGPPKAQQPGNAQAQGL